MTARPEVVAEAAGATTFTTDGTTLFWSDGHAILKRAASGGTPTRIVEDAVSVSEVRQLQVDGDQLWLAASRYSGATCLGLVGFVAVDGGKVERVGPSGCPDGFALTSDKITFVHQSTGLGGGIVGTLYVAPQTKGGKVTVLKRGFNGSSGVATDGEYAYFASEIGRMHRILLVDGPTELVSDGRILGGADSITDKRFAVDETNIYLYYGHLNLRGLDIMKLPKAGGPATLLAEALPATPQGSDYPRGPLRLDDTHVFWSHPGKGVVRRVAKSNACDAETIATDQPGADWVTLTQGHVYWLNTAESPPRVMRMAR